MRRSIDRRSRAQRWRDTVAVLFALQAEYVDWLTTLPGILRGSATADAPEVIVNLDHSALPDTEPPRGHGYS